MPRTQSSHQKNKPFKSMSKNRVKINKPLHKKAKITSKSTKQNRHIKKSNKIVHELKEKKQLKLKNVEVKNQYLDTVSKSVIIEQLRNEKQVRIVVVIPGNREANIHALLTQLYNNLINITELSIKTNYKNVPFPVLEIVPNDKTFLKNRIIIVGGETNKQENKLNLQSVTDLLKCADIVCPVLSCKSTKTQEISLNPLEKGGAFDERGYSILNVIRSIGVPSIIGIVQHLSTHERKNHDKIEKLFKRFINSELGEHSKMNCLKGNQHEFNKLIRQMDTIPLTEQLWKKNRGFVMVEDVTVDPVSNNMTFHGYLKGNNIHANQLVHICGFDDYEIEKIQIKTTKRMHQNKTTEMEISDSESLKQYSTNPESLFPFSKEAEVSDDILSGLNNLRVSEHNGKENKMGEQSQQIDDQSDDEENDEDSQQNDNANNKEEEKRKIIEMKMREESELQFEDEIEYGGDEILREKLKDYQGLKNYKTSQWNQLQNLPDEYDRIYTFKNYSKIKQSVLNDQQSRAFAYPNFYIAVTIKNVPHDKIMAYMKNYIVILVFLLKHERKMTQIHAQVRRNPHYASNSTVIQSNQLYYISIGFQKTMLRPIFSKVVLGTQKTKYVKKIGEDYATYFYCSFYHYNYFPPAIVQIYQTSQVNVNVRQTVPIMYGNLIKCDPLHIILERIILTGYPFKINRRRSTIRFMFFNPKDVKYFKPIEVRTKMGLKGKIEESLGTHGNMKVLFNDVIKHNDTVCMYLYRRVYPQPNF